MGDSQQGATIAALEINGGDGGDLLFGGPLADRIDGGSGDDFIFGGPGDDVLLGGGGIDYITGNDTAVHPDRYENVSSGDRNGLNNDASNAATLPFIGAGTVIEDLTFHTGDPGDWYLIRTPDALRRFGNTQTARLLISQITVAFDDPVENAFFQAAARKLFLFAGATVTGSDGKSTVVPVERFMGVPEFYLLHVVNVRNAGGVSPAMGSYRLTFANDIGQVLHVASKNADWHVPSNTATDQPYIIPLGDINGDGRADFISAVTENFGNRQQIESQMQPGDHPADFMPPSFVRITLGTSDPSAGSSSVVLQVPAPITLYSLLAASWTIFASAGDINGDGIDDIVATVTVLAAGGLVSGSGTPEVLGTYILFGRPNWSGTVDLVADANVKISGFGGRALAEVVGDVNGDGIDDLLLGNVPVDGVGTTPAGAFLFYGGSNWGTGALTLAQANVTFQSTATDDAIGGGVGPGGDLNGDGRSDFFMVDPVVRGGVTRVYVYYGRAAGNPFPTTMDPDVDASLTLTYIRGMTVMPVGNLNANRHGFTPDLADDLIIFGHPEDNEQLGTYFVVLGGSLGGVHTLDSFPAQIAPSFPPLELYLGMPNHYGAGDIDGDGFDDVMLPLRVFSQSLAENDSILQHQAGAIYLGGPAGINLANPSVLLEPVATVYEPQDGPDFGLVVVLSPRTAPVGDVNGDGRPDFAQADISSGETSVFFGRSFDAPTGVGAVAEVFQYTLAAPGSNTNPGSNGNVLTDGSRPITGATGLEGKSTNEMLAHSTSVGDVNGDGRQDFLFWGSNGAYLFFGPVRLQGSGDISEQATVVFDASLGIPADTQGDINGDGLGDLLFVRNDTTLAGRTAYISIIFGRPHANWTPVMSLANASRQYTFPLTQFGGSQILPVSVHVLNYNGDAYRDVLVTQIYQNSQQERGWLFSGAALTGIVPGPPTPINFPGSLLWTLLADATTATDIAEALYGPGITGFTNIDLRSTMVLGDTNGDGLDDIGFIDGMFVGAFSSAARAPGSFGRAYILLGRPDSALPASRKFILDDLHNTTPTAQKSDVLFQDFFLGNGIYRLGDLNRDGYDDFAFDRWKEEAGLGRGALVVIYGRATPAGYNQPALGQPLLGDLVLRRLPASSLTGSEITGEVTSSQSPTTGFSLTSGDFDGDGWPDLAVGEAVRTTIVNLFFRQQQLTGALYVFRNVAQRGNDLLLPNADVVLRGQAEFDRLGSLSFTPGLDLDGQGTDELLVGAGGVDRTLGSFAASAGRVYMLTGLRAGGFTPFTVTTLTNQGVTGSGDFLVDPATGQPVVFGSLSGLPAFTLTTGQLERWYRFTLLGDGMPGNLLRLSPGASSLTTRSFRPIVEESLITSTSPVSLSTPNLIVGRNAAGFEVAGVLEFDLSPYISYRNNPSLVQSVILHLAYSSAIQVSTNSLQVSVLNAEADGAITARDATAAATLAQSISLNGIPGSGVLFADLTTAVRQAIAAGRTRLGLRLTIPGTTGTLTLIRNSAGGDTTLAGIAGGQTGVLADLFDANGVMVAGGQPLLNLAPIAAGTYYLRVYAGGAPLSNSLPFLIEITPPAAGAFHAPTDQDEIRGGDGNDLLFGNEHLDRIFGQSGTDYIVGETIELKDLEGNDTTVLPPNAELLSVNPPIPLSKPVNMPDINLRAAVARALGIPVTTSYLGTPNIKGVILDTELATLLRLDASNSRVASLTGLEYASSLEELYLSHNNFGSLAPLLPVMSGTTPLGARNLRILAIDATGRQNVNDLVNFLKLEALSLDLNAVRNLTPLAGLTALRFLSIDQVLSVAPQPGTSLYNGYGAVFTFPGTANNMNLGTSIATRGNLILIGVPGEDISGLTDVGAVYLIEANTGMLLQRYTNPSPISSLQQFGTSVAFLGDRIVIGAPGEFGFGSQSGAIYVFNGTTGTRLPYPGFRSNALYGTSIAVVGNNLLVGAPGEANGAGGAYLINPIDGSMILNFFNFGFFFAARMGTSVAAFGNNLLIGAPGENAANGTTGRVYLYDGVTGAQLRVFETPLLPGGSTDVQFGTALAVSGNTIYIGAPGFVSGTDVGRVFQFNGLTGAVGPNLGASNPNLTRFGSSLAINGQYLLVGAPGNVVPPFAPGGAVLFDSTTLQPLRVFTSPLVGAVNGRFGVSVGLSDSRILIGESGADFPGLTDAGAVHGFEQETGLTNIAPLAGLTAMEYLSLRGNQITSVAALSGMTALTHLNLENNRIAEINPLIALHPLELILDRNPLNNAAHQTVLPALAPAVPNLSFTPNANSPVLAPIASQVTPTNTNLVLNFTPAPDADGHTVFLTFASSDTSKVTVLQSGNNLTLVPASGFTGTVQITVTAQDGPTAPGDGRGRAVQQTFSLTVGLSAIQGTVWHDVNANGTRDAGEAVITGRTLYLDSNSNGVLDAGETTAVTDSSGRYAFNALAAGTYRVVQVLPSQQWNATAPVGSVQTVNLGANSAVTNVNFGSVLVVDAGVDRTALEGDTVTLVPTLVSPVQGTPPVFAFQWAVNASNGQVISGGNASQFSFVPGDNGTYTVTLTVTDTAHGNLQFVDTVLVTVNNVAPSSLNITGNTAARPEGTPFTLGIAFADPGNRDTHSIVWQVSATNGQVIPNGNGLNFTFTPADNGTYTITATVTDDDGASDTVTLTLTASNQAPQNVSAGPDRTVPEGTLVSLTGAFIDAGSADTHTFAWAVLADNGQTVAPGAGQAFSFTPTDNGAYLVTFTVTDDDGASTSATVLVTVTNLGPQNVTAGEDTTVDEGSLVTLFGGFLDAGLADSHTFTWQVSASNGQVLPAGTERNYSFIPEDDGQYIAVFTVTDDEGAVASATVIITAINVAPQELSSPDLVGIEGTPLTLAATFRDAPGDTHTLSWTIASDNGQSVPGGSGTSFTFTPTDNGNYLVTLTVTDDNGGTASTLVHVSVANAAPRDVNLGADLQVLEGQGATFTIGFVDPGSADSHVIQWKVATSTGQLVASGAGPNFAFVPTNNGTFVVTATVRDDDGAVASSTVNVIAVNRSPEGLTLNQAVVPGSALAGQTIVLSGYFRDVAGDALSATIDFGDGASVPLLFGLGPNPDLNGDRLVNESDLYLVWQELLKPVGNRNPNFDLNADGTVTLDDLGVVKTYYGFAQAFTGASVDVNADGRVNEADLYLVWQNLLKPLGNRDLRYDLNADGAVTTDDVAIVKASYAVDYATTLRSYSYALQHTYAQPGTYLATVTVTDRDGGQSVRSLLVQLNAGAVAGGTANMLLAAAVPAEVSAVSTSADAGQTGEATPQPGAESAPIVSNSWGVTDGYKFEWLKSGFSSFFRSQSPEPDVSPHGEPTWRTSPDFRCGRAVCLFELNPQPVPFACG